MATLKDTTFVDANGDLQIPAGTTAQRPPSPEAGMIRYNTDTDVVEIYNGTIWVTQDGVPSTGFSASVTGEVSTDYYNGYVVHAFTGTGSFTPARAGIIDVLVVGGGGGGGCHVPGGGGAGGLIYRPGLSVSVQTYAIVIGAGGNGSFNPGNILGNSAYARRKRRRKEY